jgi:hypothetical protein
LQISSQIGYGARSAETPSVTMHNLGACEYL